MISILEYINEAYQAKYLKSWKPVEKLNIAVKDDDNILGVFLDKTRWLHDMKRGNIYVGMLNKNEISDPEIKLYSDKGVFTSIKDIQDAYNTTKKNLSKLVKEHKIKMSLVLNNFNIYVRIIDVGHLWHSRTVNLSLIKGIGKSIGKCSFEIFSVVDIDLSNPDNNDAKYVYKNYSQISIKKSVATSARKDGGKKLTGYCSFTFAPYHNYEDIETAVIKDKEDRNLLPALLLLYLKNTNMTFDGKKISLSLIKNQLELQEDKYKDFKEFLDNHIKNLNADVLKRHEEYLQSDDYKKGEESSRHDDYLLMTNGM